MKQGDNLAPVLFIFFINAVAESIEPEWKEADIDVPWLSSYFSHEARQEKRHGHSALTGARQDVFSLFLSCCVDDAAFILMNREDAEKAATLIPRPSSQSRLLPMTQKQPSTSCLPVRLRASAALPCLRSMINALTNATSTVAAVTASVEEDTEVPVPSRTTRSQSARLNLAATFEGFVPANNPNAWRDRDLE